MNKITSKVACAAALLSLALAPVASADWKNMAGTFCEERDDTSPEIMFRYGIAYNNSSGANNFVCPVVRDAGSSISTTVYVQDEHPSEGVECKLYSESAYSTGGWVTPTKASGGTGIMSLSLGKVSLYGSGIAYLFCRVPGKSGSAMSGITSYRYNES